MVSRPRTHMTMSAVRLDPSQQHKLAIPADATGLGAPHTVRNDIFRKGQPVTLDEDLVELRIEANRFLRPEDDPGHGWRLDHPIGKMAIFQAHLAQAQKRRAAA